MLHSRECFRLLLHRCEQGLSAVVAEEEEVIGGQAGGDVEEGGLRRPVHELSEGAAAGISPATTALAQEEGRGLRGGAAEGWAPWLRVCRSLLSAWDSMGCCLQLRGALPGMFWAFADCSGHVMGMWRKGGVLGFDPGMSSPEMKGSTCSSGFYCGAGNAEELSTARQHERQCSAALRQLLSDPAAAPKLRVHPQQAHANGPPSAAVVRLARREEGCVASSVIALILVFEH
eukprot:1159094-Pelagomonas_calceolata.AAC.5